MSYYIPENDIARPRVIIMWGFLFVAFYSPGQGQFRGSDPWRLHHSLARRIRIITRLTFSCKDLFHFYIPQNHSR